ncbi:MAG: hypothetical protein R2865_11275 [Deinococcales bacterium]
MSKMHPRDHQRLFFFSQDLTLENYRTIFSDPAWYRGYINSMI